jgi:alpha-1,2-mannosyltransferase
MRWSLLVCALVVVPYLVRFLGYDAMVDLTVYRDEGFALRHGIGLYGPIGAPYDLRATYPPFAVACFTALTVFPLRPLFPISAAVNVALLALAAQLSRRLIGQRGRPIHPAAVPVLVAAAAWCEPVFTTVCYGQINLLVLVLVLWDFSRPADARYRGIALGLAVGLKITPAIFVLYLLLTRRYRIAARATITFAATIAISLAIRAHETVRFWTDLVFRTDRVGNVANPANQSLRGVLTRALHSTDIAVIVTPVVVVVAVGGLALAVRVRRRRGEAWGLLVTAVTGLLISPISWTHHWVWCVPIAMLFWSIARDAGWALRAALGASLLVFVTYLPSRIASDPVTNLRLSAGEQLISLPMVAFGLAFLVALAAGEYTAHRGRTEAVSPAYTPRYSP